MYKTQLYSIYRLYDTSHTTLTYNLSSTHNDRVRQDATPTNGQRALSPVHGLGYTLVPTPYSYTTIF